MEQPHTTSHSRGSLSLLPTEVLSLVLASFSTVDVILSTRHTCRSLRCVIDTQVAEDCVEELLSCAIPPPTLSRDEGSNEEGKWTEHIVFRLPLSFHTATSFLRFVQLTRKRRFLFERLFAPFEGARVRGVHANATLPGV